MQHLEYENSFYNENVPELSKEFGNAFRFWLASIPTSAEVDVPADRRLGGILPYRGKSVAREIQNSKSRVHVPEPQGQVLVEILKQRIEIVHINCYM